MHPHPSVPHHSARYSYNRRDFAPSSGLPSSPPRLQNKVSTPSSLTIRCLSKSLDSQSWTFQSPESVSLATHSSKPFTTTASSLVTSRSSQQTSPTSLSNLSSDKKISRDKPLLTSTNSAGGGLPLSTPSRQFHPDPFLPPRHPQALPAFSSESYPRATTNKW